MWQGEDEESSVPDGLAGLLGLDSVVVHVGLAGITGLESLEVFFICSTRSKESDMWEEEGEDGESLSCLGLDGSGSNPSLSRDGE